MVFGPAQLSDRRRPPSIWTPPQLGTTVPRGWFLSWGGPIWRGFLAALGAAQTPLQLDPTKFRSQPRGTAVPNWGGVQMEGGLRWSDHCTASGPTKPLLTNPYFGFLQFLAFFVFFLDLLGPWLGHGQAMAPTNPQKIQKRLKTAQIP